MSVTLTELAILFGAELHDNAQVPRNTETPAGEYVHLLLKIDIPADEFPIPGLARSIKSENRPDSPLSRPSSPAGSASLPRLNRPRDLNLQAVMKGALTTRDGCCVRCQKSTFERFSFEAAHVIPWSLEEFVQRHRYLLYEPAKGGFDVANGMLLCIECHRAHDGGLWHVEMGEDTTYWVKCNLEDPRRQLYNNTELILRGLVQYRPAPMMLYAYWQGSLRASGEASVSRNPRVPKCMTQIARISRRNGVAHALNEPLKKKH